MSGSNGLTPQAKSVLKLYKKLDFDSRRQFNYYAPNPDEIIDELEEELASESVETIDHERFILHTAADALETQEQEEYIVKGIFSARSVGLGVGEGGSKKTFGFIDCGVTVALGESWLGFETLKVPVLFIDEESGPKRFARRLGSVLRGHGASGDTPFNYISLAQFDLRNLNDINSLQLLIIKTGARLVFIDALADIMPGADENAVRDIQPLFLQLRRLANACNCCIVLIHHANKSGGYRGSTALKGAVDLMLMVESKPESSVIDFKTEKNRDGEPLRFSAIAHFEQDQVWLTSSEASGKTLIFSKAERYILQYLKEKGDSDIETLKNKADSCAPNSVRQAVYSLADKKLIERKDAGGRGATALYGLREGASYEL